VHKSSILVLSTYWFIGCGQSSMGPLVSVSNEAAGPNCASGGVAIRTGTDANGDGALDANEASSTQYVCNAPMASSFRVLTRLTPEPAGANCTQGGVRLEAGLDDNGDSTLGSGEVDTTQYICDTSVFANAYAGDLYINSAADLARAQQYTAVLGGIYINYSGASLALVLYDVSTCDSSGVPATSFSAPKLASIGGDLDVSCNTELASLSLPVLRSIGDDLYIESTKLTSLSLPALETVSDGFNVRDNTLLNDCGAYMLLKQLSNKNSFPRVNVSGNIECTDTNQLCPVTPIGADMTFRICFGSDRNYATSRTMCQSIGAKWDLLYFNSNAELGTVASAFRSFNYQKDFWVGYSDSGTEGTFVWVQNSSGTYAPQSGNPPWGTGQPDNGGTGGLDEDCAHTGYNWQDNNEYRFNDRPCTDSLATVCRYLP
jgi:hypothetical protein